MSNYTINWEKPSWSGVDLTKKTIDLGKTIGEKRSELLYNYYKGNPSKTYQELLKRDNTFNLQAQLYSKGFNKETDLDGKYGNKTKLALNKALKSGYVLKDNTLMSSELAYDENLKDYKYLEKPGLIKRTFLKFINSSPATALANAGLHGKFLGTLATYTEIPEDLKAILSDQNLFIYDNWEDALNYNIGHIQAEMSRNLSDLRLAQKENNQEKVSKLLEAILKNKNSIKDVESNKLKITQAGGLAEYLKAHPGERMVIGGNFRFYKDKNKDRFPKNTPTGYANFDGKLTDYYSSYALTTPLGKVENIYGNNAHSFTYNPKTNQIETAFSDAYDFDAKGTESNSTIAKLRERAGKMESLKNTGVKYRVQLSPIKDGSNRYVTSEQFGTPEKSNSILNNAINAGRIIMGDTTPLKESKLGQLYESIKNIDFSNIIDNLKQ